MATTKQTYWVEHCNELPHKDTGYWVDANDYDAKYEDDYEVLDAVINEMGYEVYSSDVIEWAADYYTTEDVLSKMEDGDTFSDIENEYWEYQREHLPCIEAGERYEANGMVFLWVWDQLDHVEPSAETPAPEGGGVAE